MWRKNWTHRRNTTRFLFQPAYYIYRKKFQSKQISHKLLTTVRFQLNFSSMVFNIWCKTPALKKSDALSKLCQIFEGYNWVRYECYSSKLLHTHTNPCIAPTVHSYPKSRALLTTSQKDVMYRVSETTQVRNCKPSK